MAKNLELVDRIIKEKQINPASKAFLLLKLSEFSRLLAPEKFDYYWKELQAFRKSLSTDNLETYNSLSEASETQSGKKNTGFAAEIIDEIGAIPKDNETAAKEALEECEKKLKKAWWKGGKTPAWNALAMAWLDYDREQSIRLLKKLKGVLQTDYISEWNSKEAFSPEEWKLVKKSLSFENNIENIVEKLLDSAELNLNLPKDLLKLVSKHLERKILVEELDPTNNDQNDALIKYFRLVMLTEEYSKEQSFELMKDLFISTIKDPNLLSKNFINGYHLVRNIVSNWYDIEEQRSEAIKILKNDTPTHLKEFVLSVWYAEDYKFNTNAYSVLLDETGNSRNAELNFLVSMADNEHAETVYELAEASANRDLLMANVKRLLICVYSSTARKLFEIPDSAEDPVSHLFMLSDTDEKVEFLRKITKQGEGDFPKLFWRKPTVEDGNNTEKGSMYNYYKTDTPKNQQFGIYMMLNGYDSYSASDIDIHLLHTLISWRDQYPDEVHALLKRMWNTMKPSETELQFDLLRNSIFERCRLVFGANEGQLFDFMEWLNRKFVKSTYQYQIGDMVYTLSFKKDMLLLFCIIAAEKVQLFSQSKADAILIKALEKYVDTININSEFIKYAANTYCSDKGLDVLFTDFEFPKSLTKVWQQCVIEVNLAILLNEIAA